MTKINFKGFISGNSGYSVLSRALISLMDRAGLDVRVEDLHGNLVKQFQNLQQKDPKGRLQLLHQIPTVDPWSDAYYTVTEFSEPTYGSISLLNKAKFILTESYFCKRIFQKFVDTPTHVIHYPMDEQYKPEGPTYKFSPEIEKFGFKFLSVFEWVMRKDPYTLIEAFVEEFDKDEDVCLILRCWSQYQNPRKWIGILAEDHNVFYMPETVPHLAPLYRACDAYVTTTLGEGFGHTAAEAMACGLTTLAPRSSGILDYANDKNCVLLDTHEKMVAETHSFQTAGNRLDKPHHPFGLIKPWFKCKEVDKDYLKVAMRKAYDEGFDFITNNAPKIRDEINYEHSLEQIKKVFNV